MIETLTQNSVILVLLALWTLPWKGAALWKSAEQKNKKWFIALLVLNTAAILEILYIFYFIKRQRGTGKEEKHHAESEGHDHHDFRLHRVWRHRVELGLDYHRAHHQQR